MKRVRITISRPVRTAALTLTYVGHIWRKDTEARISCTCGWVDKAYADRALLAAEIHAESAHGADIATTPVTITGYGL